MGAGILPEGQLKIDQLNSQLDQQKPFYNKNLPKEVDLALIHRRIEELNYIQLKEGNDEIVMDRDGIARFKKKEPLLIAFFKNGVILKGSPLFTYGSKDAVNLLADILDGYFPKQLEKRYPDGVLLKLLDK